jgi:hypothetical protein
MKNNLIVIISCVCVFASCHKAKDGPSQPGTGGNNILLKEINIERLPAPYFQFTYDNNGFVKQVGFSNNFSNWKVQYQNNRVIRMIDKFNDTIAYSYSGDKVVYIKHTNSSDGRTVFTYSLTYDNTGLLKEVQWWDFVTSNGDSALFRKTDFSYYTDGNLQEYIDSTGDFLGHLAFAARAKYTNYDQNPNVDDITILKNFFDDFLFLPQVKLQKNNPAHETYEGVAEDYSFDFAYHYNSKKLPVEMDQATLVTRGNQVGFHSTSTTLYTYY